MDQDEFIDIRYIITLALQKMKFPREKLLPNISPVRPVLIEAVFSTKKGCGMYYKYLTKEQNLKNGIETRDMKWHEELGCLFSVQFWDKARR